MSTKSECLSTKELAQTMEFQHLTPKMQTWVLTYAQNYLDHGTFDLQAATKKAYVCKNDESARVFGYQIMGNPKILLALNRFFGVSPKEVFLKQVERALYNKKLTIAQVRALELTAQANGWTSGLPRHQDLRVKPPKAGKPEASAPTAAPEASPVRESVQSAIPIFPPKYRVGTIANDPDDGKPYILLAVSPDGDEVTEARLLVKSADGTFVDSIAKGTSPTDNHMPPGATPLVDKKGTVKGYRTADGCYVRLADIEVK